MSKHRTAIKSCQSHQRLVKAGKSFQSCQQLANKSLNIQYLDPLAVFLFGTGERIFCSKFLIRACVRKVGQNISKTGSARGGSSFFSQNLLSSSATLRLEVQYDDLPIASKNLSTSWEECLWSPAQLCMNKRRNLLASPFQLLGFNQQSRELWTGTRRVPV